jgi:hypothetical protein
VRRFESLAALAAGTAFSIVAAWRLLRPNVLSDDALVHQYWLWRYRDPQLFTDALTAELRESSRYPEGYELLFRVASQVLNPITFGEWVGIGLMAVSAWLVFLIVREHSAWRPAAWIGAALFLSLVEIHRFYGGFPRAFVHPVVLLTVLLALKRRDLAAALVAAGGALLYPPAALLAVGVLCASALRWEGRPRLDARRARFALLAAALVAAAVLGPQLLEGAAPRVMTADEARSFPEFGPAGTLHFFADSTVGFLRQNRSGFDLRTSGSILALAALALLLVRPANVRLLRAEVLALPVVALAAWGVAHAVLFRLYLPHRYTYPLVAFFAIAVAVTIRPTWCAARGRGRLPAFALLCAPLAVAAVAVYAFPLALATPPELSWTIAAIAVATLALALWRPALGAALTALLLVATILVISDPWGRGTVCPVRPGTKYIRTLPKDAVIAGDPIDLKCLPATARRPVVISTQLAPAYEADYFRSGRARMFASLRAYYGPSASAIADLGTRYGATHLWVRRGTAGGARWRRRSQPYGSFVRRLIESGEPAVLRLPARCRRWRRGAEEVYDIRCLSGG